MGFGWKWQTRLLIFACNHQFKPGRNLENGSVLFFFFCSVTIIFVIVFVGRQHTNSRLIEALNVNCCNNRLPPQFCFVFFFSCFRCCLICVGSFGILAYLVIFGCWRLTFLPSLIIPIDAAIMCTFISSLISVTRWSYYKHHLCVTVSNSLHYYMLLWLCVRRFVFVMIDSNSFWLVKTILLHIHCLNVSLKRWTTQLNSQ